MASIPTDKPPDDYSYGPVLRPRPDDQMIFKIAFNMIWASPWIEDWIRPFQVGVGTQGPMDTRVIVLLLAKERNNSYWSTSQWQV